MGSNPGAGRGNGCGWTTCSIEGGLGSWQSSAQARTCCPVLNAGLTLTPWGLLAPVTAPAVVPSAVTRTLQPTRRLPTPVRTPQLYRGVGKISGRGGPAG